MEMKGGVEPHPVSRQARLEQMESEELQDWANLVATRKKNEEKQRAWAALRFRSESRRIQQHNNNNNNNKGKKSKEADSDDEMQLLKEDLAALKNWLLVKWKGNLSTVAARRQASL